MVQIAPRFSNDVDAITVTVLTKDGCQRRVVRLTGNVPKIEGGRRRNSSAEMKRVDKEDFLIECKLNYLN